MADRKISDLTALTTPASGDFLPIVDISEAAAASKNKRITIEELMRGVPNGTAAAPGIAFETDPNTGIYSPGADQLAISTNGTGRLFVDASGNVGVKIASPSSQVLGAAASSTVAVTGASGGSVLVLQNDQGTVSTNARIELNGVSSGGNPRQISYIESLQTAATGAGALVFGTHSGAVVVAATERLRITSAGLVGIGTSSPSGMLDVSGSSFVRFSNSTAPTLSNDTHAGEALFIRSGGSAGDGNVQAVLALGKADGASVRSGAAIGSVQTTADVDQVGLAFYTSGSTASSQTLSERVRVTHAGNVGIGDTAPDALLTVNGVVSHGAGSASAPSIAARGDLNTGAFFPAADTFGVATGGSERARIDSSGRLLVGTSSARANFFNAASGTGATLQIEGTSYQTSSLALINNEASTSGNALILAKSRGTSVGSNTILNSGDIVGTLSYQGNDGSEFVEAANIKAEVDGTPSANDLPGRLVFSTTADGASSPSERMRITSAGVLQIADAGNITVGTTTGTKIGTATTQKIGFYNATPVVQPTAVADATDAASVITQLNALLAKLRTLGIIAT